MKHVRSRSLVVLAAAGVAAFAGCGGGSSSVTTVTVQAGSATTAATTSEEASTTAAAESTDPVVKAVIAALKAAGWSATATQGMTPLAAGAKQVGSYTVTAPNGDQFEIQFLDSQAHAADELASIQEQDSQFMGVQIGSAIVWVAPDGHTALPAAELGSLQGLLPG